jgi:hypothetical protein
MTTNLAKAQRLKNHRFMQRLMLGALVGSGLFHSLAIGLVYLRPSQVAVKQPEPEMEILIEDMPPIEEEILAEETQEEAQLAGSTGGDDVMEVATLTPAQAMQAEESPNPEAAPDEITEADLANPIDQKPVDKPKPDAGSETNKDPDAIKGDRNQEGEKKGNLEGGSDKRGLAEKTGLGAGTGDQKQGNGGEGKQGNGGVNEGGKDKKTVEAKKEEPKKPEQKKEEPKKEEPKKPEPPKKPEQVAIKPKPEPPKEQPSKPRNKSNFGYDRDASERIATGTKGRFSVEYDEKGRVKGGKLISSTGDAELDAAQLRDFNRALENNKKLRDQLENRAPESRGKPVRFVFEGDGENNTERQQIQRNRDLMAQQESDRAAAQAAAREAPSTAVRENPAPGGISIPLPIELPNEPAPSLEPAPSVEPVEPAAPAYEPPVEPAAPAYEPPVEPAAPAYEPPVEPAAPAYEPPVEPAAPAYEPPPEPAYEPPPEPAYEPPPEPAAAPPPEPAAAAPEPVAP